MLCSDFHSAWVHAQPASPLKEPVGNIAVEIAEHIAECASCAELARRLRIQAGLLSTLEVFPAPQELDHRVAREIAEQVAEAQSVEASPRVRRFLEHLGRVAAPDELEDRVASLLAREHQLPVEPGLRAPAVLDRLVEDQLRDLPKAMAAGMLSKLERPVTPVDLEERVHADLLGPAEEKALRDSDPGRAPKRKSWTGLAAAACALGLIGWVLIGGWDRLGGAPQVDPGQSRLASAENAGEDAAPAAGRRYRFEVVEHSTWEEFRSAAHPSLVSVARNVSGDRIAGGKL